jgi:hypothetical protein
MDDNGNNVTQFRGHVRSAVCARQRRVRIIVNCGKAVAGTANILHFVTSL